MAPSDERNDRWINGIGVLAHSHHGLLGNFAQRPENRINRLLDFWIHGLSAIAPTAAPLHGRWDRHARLSPIEDDDENDSQLDQLRVDFFRVYAEVFDGLGDDFAADLALFRQREQGADNCALRVHFEKSAQTGAGVAAAKAVGAKCEQTAGNPRRDLFGHGTDVVRNRDECPLLFRQKVFEIGLLRRLSGMKHVPSLAANGIVAQQFITGGAPNIGADVVTFGQNFLGAQSGIDDRTAAEDVGLDFLALPDRL